HDSVQIRCCGWGEGEQEKEMEKFHDYVLARAYRFVDGTPILIQQPTRLDRESCLLDRGDQQERLRAAKLVFDSEPVVTEGVRGFVGGVPLVEGWAVLASAGGGPVPDDDPSCGREHPANLRERVVAHELVKG